MDSSEFSRHCEQWLIVRSKVMPARTWSLKLKRDSWMLLLYGRTLSPFRSPVFTRRWVSSLVDTHASLSHPQVRGLEKTIQGTCGRLSGRGSGKCNRTSVSLKMSKATSPLDSRKFSVTWEDSVIRKRGEYSARLKLAHLTRERESSSSPVGANWPTASTRDHKDTGDLSKSDHRKCGKLRNDTLPRMVDLSGRQDRGEAQYEWEPSRTLGKPSTEGLEGGAGEVLQERGKRLSDANRRYEGVRPVKSTMGGDLDGASCGLDTSKLYSTTKNRTDELRLLGNGVVPDTAALAFRTLYQNLFSVN